ncbi:MULTISPECIES: cation:proton antiporter regulatory subunit [Sporolactobacillus]|jgi:TrkA domain protein|uniref:TrkA domain protein n=2 Tax=Sporolactobacillus TaxID=2077 RepID=A0A4Y1ZE66_9BACL|nr:MULTISPECIES: cation:proton antiporter regulatory subunit [Sporolactobacillus]QAA23084.1 potassium:proton antiporter [Sporolactobacillus terrae]QAA26056.1 potassium:proton antiporter [Sporolactobacillus terrae]UAK15149.1 cation:proton antiporter regulatory subunit [Sporolactobacillus terrae]BBN99496.1 K(+)/H(+) antiporter subunit KhtT [Sporolactobacillus terrae]GAY77395.1 trkA domain protein [Sporolactobacillus inulinus]
MNIKETELPGIGKKFALVTDQGERIVVVIHDDGRRDIYHFAADDPDECISSVTMTDSEARQFAAIVGGMVYKPKAMENVEIALNDLIIEWRKVAADAPIIGKTIGEVGLRQNYHINVIGIIRKDQSKQLNPGVDSKFSAGDTVVASGERADLRRAFNELFTKGKGE